jgi:hypothetical protein
MTERDDRIHDRRSTAERDEVDRLLAAAFADRPVPAPSPRFDARLARRLEAERQWLARRRRRWLVLLAVYWLAALVGIGLLIESSGLTLHLMDLPAAVWTPVTAVLVLTLAGVALPLAALADRWSRTPGLPRRVRPAGRL